ncbi:hypothetical protein EZV62_026064 [Acer yangbiense]|uniref:Protein kinase domain-containing protein n=1 Tax=Acer yangbiense TaxID=1000413 RepID=A0A5C7GQD3_9ROSI|nr:hypothetical protein EZV62_026064 [Acer yangbiense]
MKKDEVKECGLMEEIEHEISVMQLVRHPNIVELKQVMATKTKIFCVMEYVKGGELFAKMPLVKEAPVEGNWKGKLAVTAEVALVVTVVELSKLAGDSVDQYRESCEEDYVRPALKNIVWSWQGESIN